MNHTQPARDVAEKIDQTDAVQAVDGACTANRLAVIVLCHRVIRTDGALSGYLSGIARKRQLRRGFFKVRMTVLILVCNAQAVLRIPALFIAKSIAR
ncbi:MAG: methylated-DNA--[protein]-cysteine S-methyltransferase [Symbiopectobacterium sp.]